MHALIEARPWLPRYRVTIVAESGKILGTRKFWRLSDAQFWVLRWSYADFIQEDS